MIIQTTRIEITSQKQVEFIDITDQIKEVVSATGLREGQVTIFAPHTTASIMINHNEPMLLQDLQRILYRLVPIDERYSHDMFELTRENKSDGRSNGHSHGKNMLIGTSVTIPCQQGVLTMNEKQSIFFVEFDGGRTRDVVVQVIGQ